MNILSLIVSLAALFSSFNPFNGHLLGVAQTASSDTLNTLRANVNSLATLATGFSTTTANTWTTTQTFTLAPVFTPLSGLLQGNGASAATAITGTAGQIPYYSGANAASATSTLFLTTSSLIGVGTTTPNWLLELAGVRPSLTISDTGGAANKKHWLLSSMAGNLYIGTSTDLYATSTPAVTVTNQGLVGIATSSPSRQFSVNGFIYSGTGFMYPDGTTAITASGSGTAVSALASTTNSGTDPVVSFSVVAGDVVEWWSFAHAASGCSATALSIKANIKQSTMESTTTYTTAVAQASGNVCGGTAIGFFTATTTETVRVQSVGSGVQPDVETVMAHKIH